MTLPVCDDDSSESEMVLRLSSSNQETLHESIQNLSLRDEDQNTSCDESLSVFEAESPQYPINEISQNVRDVCSTPCKRPRLSKSLDRDRNLDDCVANEPKRKEQNVELCTSSSMNVNPPSDFSLHCSSTVENPCPQSENLLTKDNSRLDEEKSDNSSECYYSTSTFSLRQPWKRQNSKRKRRTSWCRKKPKRSKYKKSCQQDKYPRASSSDSSPQENLSGDINSEGLTDDESDCHGHEVETDTCSSSDAEFLHPSRIRRNGVTRISSSDESHPVVTDNETSAVASDQDLESDDDSAAPQVHLRNEDNWKKNIRKKNLNSGQSYTSTTGTRVSGKVFTYVECECNRVCHVRFPAGPQEKMFTSFWKTGSHTLQNTFINSSVQIYKPKRPRPRQGRSKMRERSIKYFFKDGVETHQVCKPFYLGVLQVSCGRVYRYACKRNVDSIPDQRGSKTQKKKDYSSIVNHINSFPKYSSHYSRNSAPNRKYLPSNLNVPKMYDLYCEQCKADGIEPLPLRDYYRIFSGMNLSFKPPQKDTCKTCDELTAKINNESDEEKLRELEEKRELHQSAAETARNSLNADKNEASPELYVMTFDLQKALPYPVVNTSIAYYKRSMYVYNLGVHTFNEGEHGKGFMYMYPETEGGRGSQDVSSCLVKHLVDHAADSDKVILYSDSCTGQNRNIKVALSLMKVIQSSKIKARTLDHKFMVSGHSFLPNDADFGIIERASKNVAIFGPEDWMDIAKRAKRKRPTFEVIKMKREEFLSTKSLECAITNRKETTNGYKFNWLKIRWFRYERDSPLSFKFKETLDPDAEFYEVDLTKRRRGKPVQTLANIQQDVLYPQRRAVTAKKKSDMMDLLPFIPSNYQNHFKHLPVESQTRQGKKSQDNTRVQAAETAEELDDEPIYDD